LRRSTIGSSFLFGDHDSVDLLAQASMPVALPGAARIEPSNRTARDHRRR